MKVVLAVLAMTLISSFASLFLKKAGGADKKIKILVSPYFYLGGFMYVCSACINIWLLKVLPYAIALPVGSITYVWTMIISSRILKEKITKRKILGMIVIFIGVVLVAYGKGQA